MVLLSPVPSPGLSKPLTCHLERTTGGKKSEDDGLGSEAGAGNSNETRKGALTATIVKPDSKRKDSHRKTH